MAVEILSSAQNPRIKRLVQLQQKSSARRESGLFVVEGQRELMHCINAGYSIETVFFCPEIIEMGESRYTHDRVGGDIEKMPSSVPAQRVAFHRSNADVDVNSLLRQCHEQIAVSRSLYDKIAYRGGTEGIIAVVKAKRQTLSDLHFKGAPLIIVLESVEKPGNLGAVLRSADAAQADAVVICDPMTDLFNPNLIRSSLGAIFTVPCVACTTDECIEYLKRNGVQILTAQLQDSHLYYETPMCQATAIVMGTEATGLTPKWREVADAHIRIPMLGHLDSLNVSVSAAILLFEAVRQRMSESEN